MGLDDMSPFTVYGLKAGGSSSGTASGGGETSPGLGSQAGAANRVPPWHPDSALFWVGLFGLVAVGAIGASTSVRVGPFKVAGSAGKSK